VPERQLALAFEPGISRANEPVLRDEPAEALVDLVRCDPDEGTDTPREEPLAEDRRPAQYAPFELGLPGEVRSDDREERVGSVAALVALAKELLEPEWAPTGAFDGLHDSIGGGRAGERARQLFRGFSVEPGEADLLEVLRYPSIGKLRSEVRSCCTNDEQRDLRASRTTCSIARSVGASSV
jgi:hypothetical protein